MRAGTKHPTTAKSPKLPKTADELPGRPSLCAALGSAPRRKVSARALAYRLRYLTEQMTELAHEIGDSGANEAGVVCSELLVMRDNVWFMAKRVLPPNK